MLSSVEIKSEIHNMVENIHDLDILRAIRVLLSKQNTISTQTDFWDELPDSIKNKLDNSIKQADEGKMSTHDEVKRRLNIKFAVKN